MDIVNPNYLNYMEQIQKNREDIEKLYDQELSDITQLNFKENEENGLNYENGKATFFGKSTIIRDENTENLELDSKVELKISSGDDDIVIDAGEDNSTLEIHLDNETRNNITRALKTPLTPPSEEKFVTIGTNNDQNLINSSAIEKTENKVLTMEDTYGYLNDKTKYPCLDVLNNTYRGLDTFRSRNYSSWEEFQEWVKNSAPVGSYIQLVFISGGGRAIWIEKTSSSYASYIYTSYSDYKIWKRTLSAGVWGEEKYITINNN